jgi:hypothetical protein
MPDKYGFDHLPRRREVQVRCVECGFQGPIYRLPVGVRAAHARTHEREAEREEEKKRRQLQRERIARIREINRLRREARR